MAVATSFLPVSSPSSQIPEQSSFRDAKTTGQSLSADATFLEKKYASERDKRLRAKHVGRQKDAPDGVLRSLLDDPFTEDKLAREPLRDVCSDILIIGGGFGGQMMAVELLKRGLNNFRIVEKGGDFGGAWYWNQYPGAQCDIESYIYMPLLEETGYTPTRKYVDGPELLDHARRIARHHKLYDKALLETEVNSLVWDDKNCWWIAHTNHGDTLAARFVVSALGPLHRPKLPPLPDLGIFKGHSFHTSRWDYSYTGGTPKHGSPQLERLANKRVGLIGTGASAVQIVPHLGKWAQRLYVFQRTPSSVDFRENPSTDPAWAAKLQPGWQHKRMDNFNQIMCGLTPAEDLVSDGWTKSVSRFSESHLRNASGMEDKTLAERKQLLDFEKMEQIRQHVAETVKDSRTANSLKPYYNLFCKRPCWSDEYLQTFNQQNVVLVDTLGEGVERVTEKGIIVNGEEYELDCLVLATGFEITTPWWQRSGIEVYGRNGVPLRDAWAGGPRTRYGFATRGFPNCFFMQVAQTGLSSHFLHVIGYQAEILSQVIQQCCRSGTSAIEPTQEAQDRWVDLVVESRKAGSAFRQQCTPGYYNNDGAKSLVLDRSATYGGTALEYMNLLHAWISKGELEGFERHHETGHE